jgi:hypothetical protein
MKGLGHDRSYTLAMHGLGANEFADHIGFFLFSEDGSHLCRARPTIALRGARIGEADGTAPCRRGSKERRVGCRRMVQQ